MFLTEDTSNNARVIKGPFFDVISSWVISPSAELWLNKAANSSRLLTVRIGRRGCDEWRWIAFLASVFVIVSSDLKTDSKTGQWIRTLSVIYMSLYNLKGGDDGGRGGGTKEKRTGWEFHPLRLWLIARCSLCDLFIVRKRRNHSIFGDPPSNSPVKMANRSRAFNCIC